jgi:manganese efflux pump family protein
MLAAILLFVSLGLDTLAVAVGLGLAGLPRARWLRVGVTFAMFEGLMPVVGLLVGQTLSSTLGALAEYGAAIILIAVGGLAVREALGEDDDDAAPALAAVAGPRLFWTGFTISLDELAVGFSLGVLQVAIGPALVYIGVQALALTFLGLALGRRLGARLGSRAELASGIVLLLLGAGLLAQQILGFEAL